MFLVCFCFIYIYIYIQCTWLVFNFNISSRIFLQLQKNLRFSCFGQKDTPRKNKFLGGGFRERFLGNSFTRQKNFADFFHGGGPEEKSFHVSWLWHGKSSLPTKNMTKKKSNIFATLLPHFHNISAALSQQFRNTPRYFATRSQHLRDTFAVFSQPFRNTPRYSAKTLATLSTHFHKTLRCCNTLSTRSRNCRRNSHQVLIDPSSLFPRH